MVCQQNKYKPTLTKDVKVGLYVWQIIELNDSNQDSFTYFLMIFCDVESFAHKTGEYTVIDHFPASGKY